MADEVFITSTAGDIMPVKRIDDPRSLTGKSDSSPAGSWISTDESTMIRHGRLLSATHDEK
ncbi:hypothetical protein NKI09_30225 [Mesorhizobium sp. M0757]|uniref:hypothetical protein n=1 Tax=unclassified Mesorhizobium TaxID=325217 RepID=UPI0033376CA2